MRNLFLWLVAAGLLSLSIAVAAFAQCQLAFNEQPQNNTDVTQLVDWAALDAIDPYNTELNEVPKHMPELYQRLAWEAYEAGDYEKAARAYLFILQSQRDPLVLYNLACCYGLMERGDLAAKFLAYAADYGYSDAEFIGEDPDFDAVRDFPAFAEAVAKVRTNGLADAAEATSGEDMYIGFPLLMKCRKVLPADYDASKTYPLVIGLHGAGDTPERFSTLCDYFESRDFIYAAPQAPYCSGRNRGFLWFGQISAEDEAAAAEARTLNSAYILHLIDRLEAEHKIGPVYLVGFSQGAEMAYLTGIHHPEVIDGVVAFGGRIVPEWLKDGALEKASGLRVFIAHGDEDGIERATAARDLLAQAGIDVELHQFSGGHFIHLDTLRLAEQWMKQTSPVVALASAHEPVAELASQPPAERQRGVRPVEAEGSTGARKLTKQEKEKDRKRDKDKY